MKFFSTYIECQVYNNINNFMHAFPVFPSLLYSILVAYPSEFSSIKTGKNYPIAINLVMQWYDYQALCI